MSDPQTTTDDAKQPPTTNGTPAIPSKPRKWQPILLIAALIGAGSLVGGWYAWRTVGVVVPPAVDLDGADAEVAAAITRARTDVLAAPRSPAAWSKLGKILAAHRFLDAARVCFIAGEKLQADEARWPYFHGLTLVFSDDAAAIAQFQRAIRLKGAEPAMRFRLAEMLTGQGQNDEAEEHYRLLLNDPSLAPRAELGLARLAFQRGDPDAARRLLEHAASEPETRKAAHTLLSEIAQLGDDTAAAVRERAIVSKLPDDPDWPDPLLAEITREKAGKDVRLARALELSRQNRVEDAAMSFQELVRSYPDWDQAWLHYGKFLVEHRAFPLAEAAFRNVLKRTPDSVSGHFQLGATLLQRGDNSEAAAHFRETIRLKPDHAMACYNLGQCLKRLNDRPGAVAALRQAVRFRPDMARAHTELGQLLAELGDKSAAAEEVRLSLDLNPDDEAAKKLREQLVTAKER